MSITAMTPVEDHAEDTTVSEIEDCVSRWDEHLHEDGFALIHRP